MTVSAPGKAMILGEYAVVAGGWAVVAAVDRRVTVVRQAIESSSYELEGPLEADDSLVEAVLNAADESGASHRELRPGHFRSNVTQMFRAGQKLGIGSSSASAVALTAAALGEEHLSESDTIFERASLAHSRWQGGRGSGAGLAAATWGGYQAYRLTTNDSPLRELVEARSGDEAIPTSTAVGDVERAKLTRPESLRFELVGLPTAADTRSFLDAVTALKETDPSALANLLDRLARIGQAGVEAFHSGEAPGVVEEVARAEEAMEDLGELADVPIVTDEHRRLRGIADDFGLATKPSGAGGGDISLLAGPQQADWASAMETIRRVESFYPLGAALGAQGVRREKPETRDR
jgi:phosphomevalonate kinase